MSVSPLLSFVVSAIAAWVGGFRHRIALACGAAQRSGLETRFHCVSICPCEAGCDTVLQLEGRRFLPAEAPPVPLPGCTRIAGAGRTCVYRHHPDRRSYDRRTGFGCGAESLLHERSERRSCPGRRRSDHDDTGIGAAG